MFDSKPLLIFPSPESVSRLRGYGGGSEPPRTDSLLGRAERISKQFENIISYVQNVPDDSYEKDGVAK